MFNVKVLVRNPQGEVWSAMLMANKYAPTRNGLMTFMLPPNEELSRAIYPDEWAVSGNRLTEYRPDFADGVVHTVYDFPEELAEASYQLCLEAAEDHAPGSYCQVVTDYHGGRLKPYRRQRGSYHPTVSYFSGVYLGALRLDANAAYQQGVLVVRRAKVGIVDGLVTVTTEQLLRLYDPRLATHKLTELPGLDMPWHKALAAHYQRWECDRVYGCEGHYHLD